MQWLLGHQLLELRPLIMNTVLRIGTRKSALALWQANWVQAELLKHDPLLSIQLVTITTKGDKILDVPLAAVGGKGLFVKEIEEALAAGRIDLAVHSMKDMPAELPPGLCIGPIPAREDPADALVAAHDTPFDRLPRAARIGTSSLRRAAQLRCARPDIEIVPLRGNVDTRLKKLDDPAERLDAIVLAAAGLRRLGLAQRITALLEPPLMLPAAGQGALCIEIRQADRALAATLAVLDHAPTRQAVLGERSFLHRLEGSCQVPIAAHGTLSGERLTLEGLVADIDGQTIFRDRLDGPAQAAGAIGRELAERLLSRGADKVLEKLADYDT
ncbi:MAG: hydroxymethylbilane synthase [Desulfobacterales bacterium]